MEPDDGLEEDGPFYAWLPPDDRLWRHPSEVPALGAPDARRRLPLSGLLTASPVSRVWTVAVVAGVIGALAASGVGMVSGAFGPQTTVVHPVVNAGPTVTLASATGPTVDWTAVNDAIAPSVVDLEVSSPTGLTSGSGLVFPMASPLAYVITDSTLVAQANSIEVLFTSGAQYRGHLVGSDPLSGLALVAVPNWQRTFPQLGSVANLQLANPVLAVGARTSVGGAVFPGSVTAEDRQVDLASGTALQNLIAVSGASIPTTAAGGPLLDQQGQVVGITVDTKSLQPTDATDQTLGFAVPVDVAMHVAEQLLAGTSVTHPWVGVTDASDISSTDARQFGLDGGAHVGQVSPGSPASRLGLASNDIITWFCDKQVTSTGALTQILSECPANKTTAIRYLHNGKPIQASVWVASNQPDND